MSQKNSQQLSNIDTRSWWEIGWKYIISNEIAALVQPPAHSNMNYTVLSVSYLVDVQQVLMSLSSSFDFSFLSTRGWPTTKTPPLLSITLFSTPGNWLKTGCSTFGCQVSSLHCILFWNLEVGVHPVFLVVSILYKYPLWRVNVACPKTLVGLKL